MVEDLAGVVEDRAGRSRADDLLQRQAFEPAAGQEFIQIGDVAGKVLAVVELQRPGADHRLERIQLIGQVNKGKHGWKVEGRLQEVVLFDVLEILVGVDLELAAGGLVGDNDGVGMELQAADGPHVVDAFLDAVLEGAGLAMAIDHDHHLLSVHHGADADGEGGLGDLVHVVVEEAAVGDDGVGGEGLLAGAAGKAGAGLVEGDVAVGADAAHEEVDAAGGGDGLFIVLALGLDVGGVAVEDMDVLLLDVDVAEEVVPHEGVVTLGVLLGEVDVLVHVEGDDVPEGDLAGLVEGDQFPVHSQGGTAGGAAEFEGLFGGGVGLVDAFGHIVGGPFGHLVVVRFDD